MDAKRLRSIWVVAIWSSVLVANAAHSAPEAAADCATGPYIAADDASENHNVFLPVPETRTRELIVDSMMGIGFVQRKDRKGKMFAVRTKKTTLVGKGR
jgi:hypothetical protein